MESSNLIPADRTMSRRRIYARLHNRGEQPAYDCFRDVSAAGMLKLGVAMRVEPDGCLSRKSDSDVASRIPTGVVAPPYIYARALIGSMSVISAIVRSRELDCAFISVYLSIGCRAIYPVPFMLPTLFRVTVLVQTFDSAVRIIQINAIETKRVGKAKWIVLDA
jgi:hypothetical protein